MIGDVRSEIGPGVVRFTQRPVDIVSVGGGFKQKLRPFLPIVRQSAFGRLERAGIDKVPFFQPGNHCLNRVRLGQRLFGGKHRMHHPKRSEILADQRHHGQDTIVSEFREPFVLGCVKPAFAVTRRQIFADLYQIVSWVEPLWYVTNILAQGLPVTQISGSGQHIDLRA